MPWMLRNLLMLLAISLPACLYITWRTGTSLNAIFRVPRFPLRLLQIGFVLYLNAFPVILMVMFFQGRLAENFVITPELSLADYFFTYPYWWGVVVALETLPYFLLLDALALFFRLLRKKLKLQPNRWIHALRLLLISGFILYASWTIWQNTFTIRTQENKIAVAGLPPELDGLTITLVGDIQVDRFTRDAVLADLLESIKKADSDLLIFTGDLITFGTRYVKGGLELTGKMSAPLGKFACWGDHDYWLSPTWLPKGLKKRGWVFLDNQHHVIHFRGKKILLSGITQLYSRHLSRPQVEAILQKAPAADVKILFAHQPLKQVYRAAWKMGYQLVLAGHTHGGQVVIRPFGISLTPSRLENAVYAGLDFYRGMPFLITNGIGLTFCAIRYQAPAEINKITLVPAAK